MDEEDNGSTLPAVDHALLEKLKIFFKDQYEPVNAISPSVITLSTTEIYVKLQDLFPSEYYNSSDVADWLHDWGFQFTDMGQMRYEWMLKHTNI